MTTEETTTPVLQFVGESDAVACDPEGDVCALPRLPRP